MERLSFFAGLFQNWINIGVVFFQIGLDPFIWKVLADQAKFNWYGA